MNGRQNEPIARQTATVMFVAGVSGMVHSTLIKTKGTAARKRSQIDELEVREGKEWKRIEEGKRYREFNSKKNNTETETPSVVVDLQLPSFIQISKVGK
jgi:hypothetical protein